MLMMKRLLLLGGACLTAVMVLAGPVSREQALQTARDYLKKERMVRSQSAAPDLVLAYERLPKTGRGSGDVAPLYYVFNEAAGGGFVVVSGDDRVRPVMGVAERGSFVADSLPDGLKWWLEALARTMEDVTATDAPCSLTATTDMSGLKASVAPLVKTTWGQGWPYNLKCPVDKAHGTQGDGTYPHSLTGCTATAMSQVLARWKYPVRGNGTVSYRSSTHGFNLTANLGSFVFDWDKMLDSYVGNPTEEQCDAVAELMYACGLAVNMNYCTQASGANMYAHHLERFFGIDEGCNTLNRLFFTRNEWDAIIKKELSEGRPVYYTGYSMSAGHAFVCDGYNADGLFHINWGWDGALHGYFALAELNSSAEYAGAPTDNDGSFNMDQGATIGIQPSGMSPAAVTEQLYFITLANADAVTTRDNVRLTAKFVCSDGNGFTGQMGLGVFNANNEYVGNVGGLTSISLSREQVNYYYSEISLGGQLPGEVGDGVYTLRPVCKGAGGSEFLPMRGRKGSPNYEWAVMTVEGSKVTVSAPEVTEAQLAVSEEAVPIEGKAYVGVRNSLEVKIHNEGALFYGPIKFVRVTDQGNVDLNENNYVIEAGADATLRVKIQAPESGTEDVLQVWALASDNDLYLTNGFVYEQIATVRYPLTTPAAGVPQLKVNKFNIKNSTTYLGEDLDIEMQLRNDGGFYGKDLYCFVFPSTGGTSLAYVKKQMLIDKGETQTHRLNLNIDNLPAGSYFIQVFRIGEDGGYSALSTAQYSFTVKSAGSFSITSPSGYAAYCFQHAFIVPEGLDCGVVTQADSKRLAIDFRYPSGSTVPAGTAVIMRGEGRHNYSYQAVVSAEEAPVDNLLKASVDDNGYALAGTGEYRYYDFGQDDVTGLYGFYWRNETGAPFRITGKKAYLAVPVDLAKPDGYPIDEAEITGIGSVTLTPGEGRRPVIHTLSGVRVEGTPDRLPKGIYIIDGKKVLVK